MGQEHSKDLFSKQSKKYSTSRPTYPKSLFDFIVSLTDRRDLAWDCATGNGQAAIALSSYFNQVIASDISIRQIENAQHRSNIRYEVFAAEKTALQDNTVDLITVAQALHWFIFDKFYHECRRVLKKEGGIIAAWAYGLHSISPAVDKVTYYLYEDILGRYWPEERKFVENKYETIPFPFTHVPAPQFQIEQQWSMSELINYFNTWSSVQKFIEKNNYDPVAEVLPLLKQAWEKDSGQKKKITWPLYLKVGKLP